MNSLERRGLSIRGVHKRFGQRSGVMGIDLEVEPGTILALVGPSGCGKTTLLRVISGFEPPDSGTIWVGGQNVTDFAPDQRFARMVFQSAMLYPFLTVRGNLLFPRHSQHAAAGTLFRTVCDFLDINALLDRRPRGLSGGETQRVALARALLSNSSVLLLDEPLSDVDPLLARQIRHSLRRLLVEQGRTVLYVTHDQEEATIVGDSLAVMADGRIHQVGTPRELYESPHTRFVASFVAAGMPLFTAKLIHDGNAMIISSDLLNLALRIPSDLAVSLSHLECLEVGLRGVQPLVPLQAPRETPPVVRGIVEGVDQGFERQIMRVSTASGIWRLPLLPGLPHSGAQLVDHQISISLAGATAHLFSEEGISLGRFLIES